MGEDAEGWRSVKAVFSISKCESLVHVFTCVEMIWRRKSGSAEDERMRLTADAEIGRDNLKLSEGRLHT